MMKPVADQVFALWRAWVSSKSGRQRRYHEFYRTIIENSPALEHISFDQMLDILMDKEPLRLWPVSVTHPTTCIATGN